VKVRTNEMLKLYAGPQVSQAEFLTECAEAARHGRDAEIRKLTASFETKIDSLQTRIKREERELAQDQTELSQRKLEEGGTHLQNVAGLFGIGRKRSLSTSLTKRRQTASAKADVEESVDAIAELKAEVAALEKEKAEAVEEIKQRWGELANQITDISIAALKKDVLIDLFGIAWMPFHLVAVGDEIIELPGYGHVMP
jgi:hypothetical protein